MGINRATIAIAAAGAGAVLWAVTDYRAWRALGPGGLPSTWRGWLTTTRLRMMKHDPFGLDTLIAGRRSSDDVETLAGLPARQGSRPRVGSHPVPHRQLTDHAQPMLRQALASQFAARAHADPQRLDMARSCFEKHNLAVTARVGHRHHAIAQACGGEAGHVHPSDGSMHMILSPSDSCAVIERRCGELHGLAGRAFNLPATYALVYAPRDGDELATVMRILDAAIDYMAGDPAARGEVVANDRD